MLQFFNRLLIHSFEINERRSTVRIEIFCGFLHFISCLFILPVIPMQLEAADYNRSKSIQITALATAVGCIISSYITNLPFVIAPPSVVSIYIAVALQKSEINQSQADAAVILSGFALLFIGIFKPLAVFATKLIPDCIQASTAIGIGLITALAGAIELKLVVPGKYSILEMGQITPDILIAILSTVIIGVFKYYHFKGSYFFGLLFGTLTWWSYTNSIPTNILEVPNFSVNVDLEVDSKVIDLLVSLIFLYILTLNGISRTMSDLANLTNIDGSIPRGNWLFIMCGLTTILSGYFSGPPILISPETATGIKAGAKTGLSTLVCGILFSISVFLCPVFEKIPAAGTSPLLLLVGLTLFMNTSRIKWSSPDEAIPAFFVLLLIPFTYSILTGVGFGYILYILISLFTGQLPNKIKTIFYPYIIYWFYRSSGALYKYDNTILWDDINEYSIILDVNNPAITIRSSDYYKQTDSNDSNHHMQLEDMDRTPNDNSITIQSSSDIEHSMDNCLSPTNRRIYPEVLSMDLQMNNITSLKF